MGCGRYFCDNCGEEVHGVFYCRECEDTAMEFAVTRQSSPVEDEEEISVEQAKWEAGFSTSAMVLLNRASLAKLKAPLPLKDIYAGLFSRVLAYVLDWMIIIPKFAFMMYRLGLGTEHDIKYMLITELVLVFFYFLLLNYSAGMTIGKLFTGLRVVDSMGCLPSAGQAFGRAILSFFFMVPVLAPLHALCWLLTSGKQGLHDFLLFTYVVQDEPWKKMAKEAIAMGGKLPKKKTAPETRTCEDEKEQIQEPEDEDAKYY